MGKTGMEMTIADRGQVNIVSCLTDDHLRFPLIFNASPQIFQQTQFSQLHESEQLHEQLQFSHMHTGSHLHEQLQLVVLGFLLSILESVIFILI